MSEAPVKTKKRFIAGAVCPACSEPDKLMMWSEDDVPHRECVACGYSDTLNAQGLSVPKELGTRVNTSALKPAPDKTIQAVQFFPNPKLKKKPDEQH
ncbi:UNVERIFIED_ORG: putative metal-binding protein (TIGR02443 family) [Pseudomonas fluorescens]|uniref:YheV family putative zinc ribbon protein n=1 Tax=Pseudomonas TaxID=286 RepID=UPI001C88B72D|nr:YheV family putative zinc ribbon protein [Pseudomonas sp. 3-2]MDP9711927.1 putative metal-binding protein (TIGR02443 family) [Pseudomonas fluorescens]QZD71365.1 YheV family putative metal-binding protein [Pseudomonas sp. 3-2]